MRSCRRDKDKLVVLLRRFRDEVADVSGQAELGEKALTFLHKNLLTNYSLLQARVDTAVDTGVYNCVSSAVLYLIFARSVGLSVSGARTPDHAFCVVLVNGQQIDVETTNPYGFNPGSKKEFSDSFGKLTGFSYVPPGNYHDRHGIGEKELLSLILFDRVGEYGQARYYRDALQPAVSAYALMGNAEMLQVMKVAFSDYVESLAMRRDFPCRRPVPRCRKGLIRRNRGSRAAASRHVSRLGAEHHPAERSQRRGGAPRAAGDKGVHR